MSKKLVSALLAAVSLVLVSGCQTVGAALEDAKELQASVGQKITEVKSGVENVVTEAQGAYAALAEKKRQLEEMVAKINEAVDAVNKLLGKNQTAEETADLQATIEELKKSLAAAESALGEAKAAEEQAAGSIETPAEESSGDAGAAE